jgi:NAD(P)-dependent dehydrogenase (short-subunit alcohol dehydrogenase family)
MTSGLIGRRALITGGSSGIGAATARVLAGRGARVAVVGRNVDALARVNQDTGGVCITGDLSDRDCPRETVHAAVSALGGLDVVVSNAGLGWAGSFAAMSEADIDELLDVNLRSCAHLVHAALPHLRAGQGRLVFVGSIAGRLGVPGEAWYSATKAGLECFADVLRAELRSAGIGVTLVTPGVVDTAYFARRGVPYARHFPRPVSAQSIAEVIADAIEHGREDAVVPGWLSLPARLKLRLPRLYRRLENAFT